MSIRNTMTYVNDAGGGTRKKPIVDDDDLLLGVASGAYGDQDAAPETAASPLTLEEFYKDGETYTKYAGNYNAYRDEQGHVPSTEQNDDVQPEQPADAATTEQSTDDALLDLAREAHGDQDAAPETADQAAVPATAEQAAAEQPREKSGYEKWKESGNYQDLVRAYGEQSRRAMDDTLGRVSARTGGLASSYAVGAAEGARDEVMLQLEDVARSMYEGDRADARARIAAYMQNGGDPTMLSDELLQTSGYTEEELAQMKNAAGTVKSPYYDSIAAGVKGLSYDEAADRVASLVIKGYLTYEEAEGMLLSNFGRGFGVESGDGEANGAEGVLSLEEFYKDGATYTKYAGNYEAYLREHSSDTTSTTSTAGFYGDVNDHTEDASFKNVGANSYRKGDNVEVTVDGKQYNVQIARGDDYDNTEKDTVVQGMAKGKDDDTVFEYEGKLYVVNGEHAYRLQKRTSNLFFASDYDQLASKLAPKPANQEQVKAISDATLTNNGVLLWGRSFSKGDNVNVDVDGKTYHVQIAGQASDDVKAAAGNYRGLFSYGGELYFANDKGVFAIEKRTNSFKTHYNKLKSATGA